jgi:pSer/pThr/pTyr-binding forkhead associated (FHA) protein
MAKILVKFRDVVRQEYHLASPIITIGRSSSNDIPVDNLAVSRHHAQIIKEGDHYLVEDLDSNNGTYLNGDRIQNHPLKDGDNIQIGKHVLQFVAASDIPSVDLTVSLPSTPDVDDGDIHQTIMMDAKALEGVRARALAGQSPQANPLRATTQPPAPPPQPRGPTPLPPPRPGLTAPPPPPPEVHQPPKGYLTVLLGGLNRTKYDLTSPATTIGKGDAAEIRLSGMLMPNLAMVINRRPDGYYVTPSGGGWSKPHLNGNVLRDQRRLNDGDILEIRDYKFQFNLQP